MKGRFDIAVVGSGYAGSLMAMIAFQSGLAVVLLEKGKHPRMTIGESSTPLSNLLLEELATRYDLPRLKPLAKWGSWQKSYPGVACGLKRGFSFIHHGRPDHERLLVAASPHDEIADTHWYRADFDQLLVKQAEDLGVTYLDEALLSNCTRESGSWTLTGQRREEELDIRATFLLDATGPRGFLHKLLGIGEASLPGLPRTSSLYSHFTKVRRFEDSSSLQSRDTPFDLDDAALHHLFTQNGEGGWMWVLRFNNGVVSAGVAATERVADNLRLREGPGAWQRLLDFLPAVKDQFASAEAISDYRYVPHLSFLSAAIAGDGWALLPSAAGFVDPLLSTGFSLTLLGILRLGRMLEESWGTLELAGRLKDYADITYDELLITSRLVGALYRCMGDAELFRGISLLYFAAASYAETARRLGKVELASSFLLQNDPVFGPKCRRLLDWAWRGIEMDERRTFDSEIYTLIDKFDVAGLCKRPANNCYPVEASDLFANAHKFGATEKDIRNLLQRSGFYVGQDFGRS